MKLDFSDEELERLLQSAAEIPPRDTIFAQRVMAALPPEQTASPRVQPFRWWDLFNSTLALLGIACVVLGVMLAAFPIHDPSAAIPFDADQATLWVNENSGVLASLTIAAAVIFFCGDSAATEE